MLRLLILLLSFAAAAQAANPPAEPVEIVLRHALSGEPAALLVELVDRFNAQSKSEEKKRASTTHRQQQQRKS